MAEEKPGGKCSGSDQCSEVSSATTPVADISQDSIEDEAPIPRTPNSALLVLSWGMFSIGLYFVYSAGMGYYEDNVTEAKLAITVVLGVLTVPVGMFLRRAALHGFRDAIRMLEGASAGG